MELDWTTFFIEIANFLILVWILKRFLYRPVLDVIARRREGVERTLAEAKKKEDDAKQMGDRYRQRLDAWESEREQARAKLSDEIAAERKRKLEELAHALGTEREKAEALAQRRTREAQRALESEARAQGARFASRILERLAGPELDALIVRAMSDDLERLPEGQREALAAAAAQDGASLQIVAARPLAAEERQRLSAAFEAMLGCRLDERVSEEPDLVAGLKVAVGPWVLSANLCDELAFFREGASRAG